MKGKIWGVIVGRWLYKRNISLIEATAIVDALNGVVTNVAIIQTKWRRKA